MSLQLILPKLNTKKEVSSKEQETIFALWDSLEFFLFLCYIFVNRGEGCIRWKCLWAKQYIFNTCVDSLHRSST